jgi:hypothetical protein
VQLRRRLDDHGARRAHARLAELDDERLAADRVARAGQDEAGGDAAGERERARVVVRVEAVERAEPGQDRPARRVDVERAAELRRGEEADVRVQVDCGGRPAR